MDPGVELVVGCVLLVLSGVFFWATDGAIWDSWDRAAGTIFTVLGPWFIYRAWKRTRPEFDDDD